GSPFRIKKLGHPDRMPFLVSSANGVPVVNGQPFLDHSLGGLFGHDTTHTHNRPPFMPSRTRFAKDSQSDQAGERRDKSSLRLSISWRTLTRSFAIVAGSDR